MTLANNLSRSFKGSLKRTISVVVMCVLFLGLTVPTSASTQNAPTHALLPLSFAGAVRRLRALPGARVTSMHHTQIWWTALATIMSRADSHSRARTTIVIHGLQLPGYASPILDEIEYATSDGPSFYKNGGLDARNIGERVFGITTYSDFMAAFPLHRTSHSEQVGTFETLPLRAYAARNLFREYTVTDGRVNSLRIGIRHMPHGFTPDRAAFKRLVANRNNPPIGQLLANPDDYTFAQATYRGRIVSNDPATLFEEIIVPDYNSALPCYRLQVRFGFGRSEEVGYPIEVTGTVMEPINGKTAALDQFSYSISMGKSDEKICDEARRR